MHAARCGPNDSNLGVRKVGCRMAGADFVLFALTVLAVVFGAVVTVDFFAAAVAAVPDAAAADTAIMVFGTLILVIVAIVLGRLMECNPILNALFKILFMVQHHFLHASSERVQACLKLLRW